MKWRVLAALTVVTGCVSLPQNGAIKCGPDPAHACPSGFHCASNSTCWRNNQDPSASNTADMSTADRSTMNMVTTDLGTTNMGPTVIVTPPAAAWVSSGGGASGAASGMRMNMSVGGAVAPSVAKAASGAELSAGYFTSDNH
jgi:hypothetical protein